MVGSKLDVDIIGSDICTTHQLTSKSNAPTVIVKLNTYEKKKSLAQEVRQKSDISEHGSKG